MSSSYYSIDELERPMPTRDPVSLDASLSNEEWLDV